ncbi:hypothetical protein Mgra_00006029 [Meloidogyne graminicola]|uniref:Uncharacterized protein n=1 Tax=Meloidogyne graminicola TaxID=189291 RepID=A0A8S9ZMG5_9BILA|nr:hypothetical protein Mgra_00006029 [Meloidogyne graminicola]
MDEITQLMMKELLKEDQFKKLWADLAVEIEEKSQPKQVSITTKNISTPNIPSSHQLFTSNFRLNLPKNDQFFAKICKEVANGLELVIKNFSRGVHLAYFSTDKTEKDYFRHEASSLYSIQVLLERSIISNKFNSAQFGLIARRIIKMQQLFGIYTSTPYNVRNCVFLASTLYTIHTRFVDYGKVFGPNRSDNEEKVLENVIELFGKLVCKRLEKMLINLLNKQKVTTETRPFVNYINQINNSKQTFCSSQISITCMFLTKYYF